MRPILIGIGGAHSGCGKTTFASLILQRVKGLGAIKYTKTSLYSSVTGDIEVLSQEGKDTKRLLDSGAEKVLWVKSSYDDLPETLRIAIRDLSHLKGIIIEGNSAVEVLQPDIVIFIAGTETERFKENAQNILKTANLVIYDDEPPPEIPESAQRFQRNDKKGFLNVLEILLKECEKGA